MVETVLTVATTSWCGDRLIHVRRTGNVPHVNKRRTFNDPGQAHELTFSTYRRTKLFEEHAVCRLFMAKLDEARKTHDLEVWAYVVMPDHVHLLVWPKHAEYDVTQFRKSLKGAVGREAVHMFRKRGDPWLERLSLSASGLRHRTRFWQTGAGCLCCRWGLPRGPCQHTLHDGWPENADLSLGWPG